jgi:hypothetical protein
MSSGVWGDLSIPSLPPSSSNGDSSSHYDRMYLGQLGGLTPNLSSGSGLSQPLNHDRGLPMSMFSGGSGHFDDQNPRRGSHQAVEMAASALANLGNGGGSTPHISTNHGNNGNQPTGQSHGPDSAVAGSSKLNSKANDDASAASKKKRKPKQGENLDDDGRRKTARACDQCVSRHDTRRCKTQSAE